MTFTLNWPNRDEQTGKMINYIHPNMVNINNRYSSRDMVESFRKDAMIFSMIARTDTTLKGSEVMDMMKDGVVEVNSGGRVGFHDAMGIAQIKLPNARATGVINNKGNAFDVRLYHQACLLGKNMTCEQLISIVDGSASITINGDDDCTNYEVVFEGDAFEGGEEE
tara:strand:+ start:1074 stop:1571 length:498 start_codon:yes stop_codon:yes gene_type:complete